MKIPLLIAIILLLIISVFIFAFFSLNGKPQSSNPSSPTIPPIESQVSIDVNYKARFAIFTNGLKRDFSNAMYQELSDDVYISSLDPSVIIVRKPGSTWQDFFNTLPFELTKECLVTGDNQTFCANENETLKFYINGEKNDSLLSLPINNSDMLIVSFGPQNDPQLPSQLNSFNQ
jgi:hypothetical protein